MSAASARALIVGLALVATRAGAQQPADTTRPPQPIPVVRVEAAPDPRPLTPSERRLSLGGHRYSKAEIASVNPSGWMEVARLSAGVTVLSSPVRSGSTMMRRQLSMRGGMGRCTPAVFIDNVRQNIVEYDWDQLLSASNIESMEVYGAGVTPIGFNSMNNSCGVILIWTRPEP